MWKVAREDGLSEVKQFLAEHEAGCVTFSARLMRNGSSILPGRRENRISVFRAGPEQFSPIRAAILQTVHGFFYPVFDANEDILRDWLKDQHWTAELRRVLRLGTTRVHSIMGIRRDVETIESMVPKKPTHQIEYFLMVEDGTPSYDAGKIPSGNLPAGIQFRTATLADAQRIFPIQRDYEKEEVLLAEDRFDPETCLLHLRQNLSEQLIFVAELDGRPIAKAGTNARGFRYDQIGGVFTHRDLRNRGIGAAIMTRLMDSVRKDGKLCSLFVKQHNAPAIAMYTRLGYAIRDEFRITYY